MVNRKKNSQPGQVKTCGSTFKNPKNRKAWRLIKESNCENYEVGNAKISEIFLLIMEMQRQKRWKN